MHVSGNLKNSAISRSSKNILVKVPVFVFEQSVSIIPKNGINSICIWHPVSINFTVLCVEVLLKKFDCCSLKRDHYYIEMIFWMVRFPSIAHSISTFSKYQRLFIRHWMNYFPFANLSFTFATILFGVSECSLMQIKVWECLVRHVQRSPALIYLSFIYLSGRRRWY